MQALKPPVMELISCIKSVDVFCRLEVQAALLLHTHLNKPIPENVSNQSLSFNQSMGT
ncbi:MAG: hypothetical protein VKK42_11395 [Lyngbya sp.]|nr:hypothetical protein [Lyngbya sp.]